ncbi:hypothetical protein [Robiginitalea sp.]|uniref:hypothetical protein n=2 Tax=Robiginitalea sp. TaxID=1902411 RepID=UPI003C70BD44
MKSAFTEVQKFNQWWLWILLLAVLGLPVYGMFQQIILGEPFGSTPMSDLGLVLFFVGTLLIIGLVWYLELRTEIDETGIRVRLRPISTEVFTWDQIEHVEIITYGFVGYGLRFSSKYGTVYNTRGNKGLSIRLKSGSRYVIGTQDPEGITQVLRTLDKI